MEGEWIYRDADGNPYLRVRRYRKADGSKSYPQSHWNGAGWVSGRPKGPKIPYLLQELLDGDRTEPLLVLEGEKCVTRARKEGLQATCASEGAGKWTADLNEWFRDRIVWIVPDNDEPGHDHALKVAANLHGIAREVKIVELPGMQEGEDVVEFFDDHGLTADRLRELGDQASNWQPLADGGDIGQDPDGTLRQNESSDEIQVIKASSVVMTSVEWMWPGRFVMSKLNLIAGRPDEGKGQVGCDAAARVTRGSEWPNSEGRAPKGSVIVL